MRLAKSFVINADRVRCHGIVVLLSVDLCLAAASCIGTDVKLSFVQELELLREAPLCGAVTAFVLGGAFLAALYRLAAQRTLREDAITGIELTSLKPDVRDIAENLQAEQVYTRIEQGTRRAWALFVLRKLYSNQYYRCCGIITIAYIYIGTILYFVFNFAALPGAKHQCHFNGTLRNFSVNALQGSMVPLPDDGMHYPRMPLVFFSGNGESMDGAAGQAYDLIRPLTLANSNLRFLVYFATYRGYPPNNGWASQTTVTADAIAIFDYVLQNTPEATSVLIAGTSMGSAVALQLASARAVNVAGIVLHVPFRTFWDAVFAASWAAYLTSPWIWLADHWDSQAVVASLPVGIPMAVLSSGADELIPPAQHADIFRSSAARQKWFHVVPGATHSSVSAVATGSIAELTAWAKAVARESAGDDARTS